MMTNGMNSRSAMYKSIGRKIELISFRDGNGMTQWCKSVFFA